MGSLPPIGVPALVLSGRYRLDALLGQGNFGEVWQGYDLDQEDVVAVKLYRDNVTVQDVLLESRILTKVSKHTNVVTIRNVIIQPPRPYMAMDFVPNGSAERRMGPLGVPITDAHRWTRNALQGLIHVHSLGIVHRDYKPANLLIAENGETLVSDFGLAEETVNPTAQRTYRPHMAPELVDGEASTVQTDVWAVGCTLYRLVTGTHPFGPTGDPDAIRHGRWVAAPHQLNPQVPLSLERVIGTALEPDRARRYQDAALMLSDLNSCQVQCAWTKVDDPSSLEVYTAETDRGQCELRCTRNKKSGFDVQLRLNLGRGLRTREGFHLPSEAQARQKVAVILRRVVQTGRV